jgi:hypothetical protein
MDNCTAAEAAGEQKYFAKGKRKEKKLNLRKAENLTRKKT